jgi:hypothetical protein
MIVVCVLVLCAFLAAVTWLAGDALVQLVASLADDGTGGSQ